MKNWAMILIVVIAVIAMSIGGMYFSYSNDEVKLRNYAAAQEDVNRAIFDKVWKVISQQAQVADKYKNDFQEVYANMMTGRYSGKDKVLFNWIQEHNPQLDSKIYYTLLDTIAGQRESFAQVQAKLRDIKREHDNLRMTFPGSIFVGSRSELEVTIVTSDKTEDIFKTSKENDVKMF
jgi:uncharacterized protein YneF (UPF0154 family)